jgi:hypothetical protein
MVTEAPFKRIGQIVYNQTTSGAAQLVLIPSGVNLGGIVLRSCIIWPVGAPSGGAVAQLITDVGISGMVPPPPPPGTPPTMRMILVTDPATGFAQLDWPIHLDPGLGLVFNPGAGGTLYNINATWDYAVLSRTA